MPRMRIVGHFLVSTKGVCQLHRGLAIYIKKYFNAKRRIMEKLKYFTMQKQYNLPQKKKKKKKP